MQFKEYPKTYEDVYTRYDAVKKCKIENVTSSDGTPLSEYRAMWRGFLWDVMETLFDKVVRYIWLRNKFTYMGYRKNNQGGNYYVVDGAFGVFLRHYIGIDYRVFAKEFYYRKIYSYMEDFFPEFYKRDPFKEPEYYKYPYKHVTIDFLTVVDKMPQRFELLKIAEERKMMWDEFFDYVINYVLCYNDDVGKRVFSIINPKSICPPYVRNNMLNRRPGSAKRKRETL